MSDRDRSFERLRRANPAPTTPVDDKPTARQMLTRVQQRPPRHAPQRQLGRPPVRRGVLVAAAAFVVVLLVTIPVLLLLNRSDQAPPVVTQLTPPPTTAPPTTVPETTVPQTAPPADEIDAATQGLLDAFITTYNSGDVDAFLALLAPDFRREITLDRDLQTQPLATVRALYEVDAALNTELSLSCTPGAAATVCTPQRFDDLHRVLSIPPSAGIDWFLTFENGLLKTWGETRLNTGVIPYEAEAVTPFADWVTTNRPDVLNEGRWEIVFFSGGSDTWIPREGIAAEVAGLVAQWANSLGVSLAE